MVLRILVCLALVFTSTIMPMTGIATAGGPPVCYPPAPVCAPPGPALPNCVQLIGGCLGMCASICGTVIGIPAMLMSGLLAPPAMGPPCLPKFCGPPVPPPPMYASAQCAPPPQRITKCRPVGCGPYGPGNYYAPVAPMGLPAPPPPPPLPFLSEEQNSFSLARALYTEPVRMVAGSLKASDGPVDKNQVGTAYASAGTKGSDAPVFGSHW